MAFKYFIERTLIHLKAKLPEICNSVMNLDCYYNSIICYRTECIKVVDHLQRK